MSIAVCITLASCQGGPANDSGQTKQGVELQQGNYKERNADQFREMWQNKEGKLLDVRTPGEFSEGHLPGAIMIDFTSDDFKAKVSKLEKDTTYLIYCHSGHRSQMAGEQMEKMGFKVVNMQGGIMAWENNGFEIEK